MESPRPNDAVQLPGPAKDDPDSLQANVLLLPASVEQELSGSDESLGVPGRPFNRRTPFFIGLTGALGVAVAYAVVRGISEVTAVLVIIGFALFISIGLNPIIEWLIDRRFSRGLAVATVTAVFLLAVASFIFAAVPPLTHEIQAFIKNYPHYKSQISSGKGWLGRLAVKLHVNKTFGATSKLKLSVTGGVFGAGKKLLSLGVATISVIALTIYFLIALPGVERLWLSLIPKTRRERVAVLTSEVFQRVGGFMLGNLLTSLISGVGTFLWLMLFGVPYALLLGVFVALFDLIPLVGSTIAGVVVSLVHPRISSLNVV